ncbi:MULTISPECIES: AAA family ATPase [Actinosynnema]|uniref:AAA family ATPase n=1 Tax=Actinosynnema TaxID=40566 RepID=UPI0020A39CF4|nr:AAA family ATPase [Actinosynnema pretiosum]MCP2094270.1 hypothetical protein [Actinosynnema pretiosum]
MSLLGPSDESPLTPRRAPVAGAPGSGRTTPSDRIDESAALPRPVPGCRSGCPGLRSRSTPAAARRALPARPGPVVERQYRAARPVRTARVDLPLRSARPRATSARGPAHPKARGGIRCSGDAKPPLYTVFTDWEHVVLWTWKSHGRTRHHVDVLRASGEPAPVAVRSRGQREVDGWRSGPPRPAAGRGEESVR